MENEVSVVGRLSQKKFWPSLLAGFFLLSFLVAFFGFSGTFFAMPLGGMGDFYVSFDKLEGKGFTLNPHIGETGESDSEPMVRNQIESATIENLHIYKDLQLPTGHWIRINIQATQPTVIEGLIQDARFIDANLAFNDLTVEQSNTSNLEEGSTFYENWSQSADTVTILNAKIVTDYLFQNMVSLQGAEIYIESIANPEISDPNELDNGSAMNNESHHFGGNGGDQGENTNLPKTATNMWTALFVGIVLVIISVMIIIFKRRMQLKNK